MANKSGIHIKKSHKGLFTAKAKRAGQGVQEYASHVLANKDKFDTETIRQAVFAKNATKFNHAQYGADNINGPSANQLAGSDEEANENFAADNENEPAHNNATKTYMKRSIATGQENPYLKNFNILASTATGIGNIIQDHKLKNEEEAQLRDSFTPQFMQNMEQQGLDNGPAYYQYGGITADPANYGFQQNQDMGEQGMAHNSFYGQTSAYQNGGDVSADKAKEILRDGTANGYKLTDKQRRYFGWVAGGKKAMGGYNPHYQAGGDVKPPAPVNDSNYRSSATLQYYKEKLNDVLKQKNPQAYTDYFNNLSAIRRTGKQQDAQKFVQDAQYNDYLSPEEVKKALGDKDYQKYLQSVKDVNSYNLSQGSQPLYGDIEGQNDPSQLNYGRRFASLTTNPTISVTNPDKSQSYTRSYAYNPQTGNVDFTETGDTNLRPQFAQTAPKPRPRFQTGGKAYKVGDQVTLTREQLNDLRNQGYEFEVL